ncbi:MAG: hypothetical protein K2O58_06270, partial [Bacteroidales bacterium]|nr:hypothetical protein [Bacteroidales bacterium]
MNPAVPGNECLKLPESSAEKETPKYEQISGQEPHMEKSPTGKNLLRAIHFQRPEPTVHGKIWRIRRRVHP